jgi:hypothetical protein
MLRCLARAVSLKKQESASFAPNHHAYLLPWLLQGQKICRKLKTEITVRQVGLSGQDLLPCDQKPTEKMDTCWGFSTVPLGGSIASLPCSWKAL